MNSTERQLEFYFPVGISNDDPNINDAVNNLLGARNTLGSNFLLLLEMGKEYSVNVYVDTSLSEISDEEGIFYIISACPEKGVLEKFKVDCRYNFSIETKDFFDGTSRERVEDKNFSYKSFKLSQKKYGSKKYVCNKDLPGFELHIKQALSHHIKFYIR